MRPCEVVEFAQLKSMLKHVRSWKGVLQDRNDLFLADPVLLHLRLLSTESNSNRGHSEGQRHIRLWWTRKVPGLAQMYSRHTASGLRRTATRDGGLARMRSF